MRRLARALAAATMAAGVAGAAAAQDSTAVKREAWAVAGLNAPAQMVVDHWGVPHIFAASARDAFFLQGYNAARDRLWQIDLWRKRGLGRLSASFGPSYVAQDRAARLFLYRGDMAAEWASPAPRWPAPPACPPTACAASWSRRTRRSFRPASTPA
jgi:penicillin amidase